MPKFKVKNQKPFLLKYCKNGFEIIIRRVLLTDPLEHEPVAPLPKGLKGHIYIGQFFYNKRPGHGQKLRIYKNNNLIFKRIVPPNGIIPNIPLGDDVIISLNKIPQ